MKETLADLNKLAWSTDQFRALKAILQAISDRFENVLLMRGKRVRADVSLTAAFGLSLDCPFKPASVQLLSVSQDGYTYGPVPMTWVWSSTPTGGTVVITDGYGMIAGPLSGTAVTVDVFMEKI